MVAEVVLGEQEVAEVDMEDLEVLVVAREVDLEADLVVAQEAVSEELVLAAVDLV